MLPAAWEEWRRARQRELVAGGMPRARARRFARAEASGRARLAAQIGAVAAMTAPLGWRDNADGGTCWHVGDPAVRWFLTVPGGA